MPYLKLKIILSIYNREKLNAEERVDMITLNGKSIYYFLYVFWKNGLLGGKSHRNLLLLCYNGAACMLQFEHKDVRPARLNKCGLGPITEVKIGSGL
jgi:hypothetical protein